METESMGKLVAFVQVILIDLIQRAASHGGSNCRGSFRIDPIGHSAG